MIQLPFIGAFLEAVGMIFEKKILRKRGVDFKNYTSYEFLAISLLSLPFLYFFWRVDRGAFEIFNIFIFCFIILVSILANLLIFYSLKRENLTEFEPIWLMQPLFTVLLAFIFYSEERNPIVVVLALIASISLVLSHVKKSHLFFDKFAIAALFGNFFFAVELVVSRLILDYYSPFSFYFLRCLFIFIISFAIYKPNFDKLRNKKLSSMILIVGLIWILYRAIIYYGYLKLGIIFTTLLFILSPVLVFLFAVMFLKEKPTRKQIVSTAIIVACVIAAVLSVG